MIIPEAASMALPVITRIPDVADWSKTVEPFIPQLYELPTRVWESILDPEALRQIYTTTNPLISGFAVSCALFPIFLILSEINRNWSQVDRVWSILPMLYNAHYALWARMNGLPTQRLDNVLAFSVVWSIRLTFNYWRRGGYQIGSEDYRWELIKKRIGSVGFFLLNVFFIASLQSVILFAATTPTYLILLASRLQPTMSIGDMFFARALIGLVVVEWFADGQQWNYHQAKHSYQKTAKVPAGWTRAQMERGFNTTGLWKYSRHPNFAAEQSIWLGLYQWGCYGSETMLNWTAFGALAYILVFQGSTPLTEHITGGKYPEYSAYQERVGKFVPSPFSRGWNEKEMEVEGAKIAEKAKGKKGVKFS